MKKNKRGLLGTIFAGIALAVIILLAIVYFQVRSEGLTFTTGNIIINLEYDPSLEDKQADSEQIVEEDTIENITTLEEESNITVIELNKEDLKADHNSTNTSQ